MDFTRPTAPEPYGLLPRTGTFALRSSDITDGGPLGVAYLAQGGNLSPALAWEGFPAQTQSFVVSCFDPDAPTPAGFWHWTLVDIPVWVTSLETGAGHCDGQAIPPEAFQVRHDGGELGYMGAAPPAGDRPHRYVFAVHALSVPSLAATAGLSTNATPTAVAFTALFHTLARATLTATYQS